MPLKHVSSSKRRVVTHNLILFTAPEAAPPRPPTHTSIPALLQLLLKEWDAQVLAAYALQQQLQATRQELSYALYSEDAARRVIARLIRERDAAREQVSFCKECRLFD